MNSTELNERIQNLCAQYESLIFDESTVTSPFDAFGGKIIPYIGWYWREINFDIDYCGFGIIPAHAEGNDKNLTGFMAKNKWDYPYVYVKGEVWRNIKQLLETAVISPTTDNLKAVNDAIQTLGADFDAASWCDEWSRE